MTALPGMANTAEALGLNRIRPEIKSLKTTKNSGQKDVVKHLTEMRSACADIESTFVSTLIKAMRQSVPESGYLPDSPGSDIYESMADEQLSIFLTSKSGLGLGQAVFEQMVRRENLEDEVMKHPALFGGGRLRKTDNNGLNKVDKKNVIQRPGGKALAMKQNQVEPDAAGAVSSSAQDVVIRIRREDEGHGTTAE